MALPSSGQISISQISTELGRASTATTSLGESASRSLAGVPSGAISMSNFWGKSSGFFATITTNQLNLNLRTWAQANGWNGSSPATITVAPGVYIWSDSTSTPALTINGSWAGGITLINQGYIMGKGGDGGSLGAGASGGTALSLGYPATINNTYASAYIGGGGGGGGAAVATTYTGSQPSAQGGGGAGGGAGGTNGLAGAGGGIGASGSNGLTGDNTGSASGGGGGGRIFPGTGGSGSSVNTTGGKFGFGGGAGGGGSVFDNKTSSASGAGGSANSSGVNGSAGGIGYAGGGGGGWGSSGGSGSVGLIDYDYSTAGGAGGKAVALNGNTVTWVSGDTSRVYGAIS